MTITNQNTTSIASVLGMNSSFYNVTAETVRETKNAIRELDYIETVVIIVCLIIGVFGNSMTIILMNTQRFGNMASKYFLVALAISDITVLFTHPFKNMLVIKYLGQDIRSLSEIGCKFYYWVLKTGKMTSSWLVVCVSLERLFAIKFPFMVKRWFSKRNTSIIICMLYLIIGGFNAGYSYCTNIDKNGICHPDVYDQNDQASVTLYKSLVKVGVSLYFIGPLIILFISTPIIIVSLCQIKKTHSKLTHSHSKMGDIVRPTTMILSVIVAFIIFATPIGIVRIISSTIGVNLYYFQTELFKKFRDIALILELWNYAVNFFLFVASSKQFRDGFRVLLCSIMCSRRCAQDENVDKVNDYAVDANDRF